MEQAREGEYIRERGRREVERGGERRGDHRRRKKREEETEITREGEGMEGDREGNRRCENR